MKRTRSLDLRERALAALAGGMKRSPVCLVFGIHRTTLGRWVKRQQAGTLAPVALPGPQPVLLALDEEVLLAQLQEHPDATIDEHLRLWQGADRKSVSRATLGRAILRVHWTRKKRA